MFEYALQAVQTMVVVTIDMTLIGNVIDHRVLSFAFSLLQAHGVQGDGRSMKDPTGLSCKLSSDCGWAEHSVRLRIYFEVFARPVLPGQV